MFLLQPIKVHVTLYVRCCVSLSVQASLNSSMDSLKAELNTALQYDREAEDEVKKLKVRGNASTARFQDACHDAQHRTQ